MTDFELIRQAFDTAGVPYELGQPEKPVYQPAMSLTLACTTLEFNSRREFLQITTEPYDDSATYPRTDGRQLLTEEITPQEPPLKPRTISLVQDVFECIVFNVATGETKPDIPSQDRGAGPYYTRGEWRSL